MTSIDGHDPKCSLPGIFEGGSQTPAIGVVLVDQADVFEAPVPGHAGKDRALGSVGEGRSEKIAAVLNTA